jgi:hypothetical protein
LPLGLWYNVLSKRLPNVKASRITRPEARSPLGW